MLWAGKKKKCNNRIDRKGKLKSCSKNNDRMKNESKSLLFDTGIYTCVSRNVVGRSINVILECDIRMWKGMLWKVDHNQFQSVLL